MKWRCEACGKPHERNDPPCDNCGHFSLERAVVPQAPEGDGDGDAVWACTDCGRAHQRNSPPCSRCGNMQFERKSADYLDVDDEELRTSGWLDVVEPWHAAVGAVALLLAAVLVAGVLGVVNLPGVGPPTVSDVPGESESAGGLSLATVESEYVAALNDARADDGADSLDRDDTLDRMATYYNQRRVKSRYGDGEPPGDGVFEGFSPDCDGRINVASFEPVGDGSLSSFDSEAELAESVFAYYDARTRTAVSGTKVGVDVHVAPDGTVFVTQVAC